MRTGPDAEAAAGCAFGTPTAGRVSDHLRHVALGPSRGFRVTVAVSAVTVLEDTMHHTGPHRSAALPGEVQP